MSSSSSSRGAPSHPTGSAPDTKPLFLKQITPFSSPMIKSKDSIDLIEISSSDSDADYQDSVGEESDHERDGEEAGSNRRGNEEGKKGASADVSPSSVQVKTAEEKKVEDDECYILDFDPFESAVTDLANKLSLGNDDGDDREEDDLSVLAEKGEVACRDFPHSRHLCAEFLFDGTPHESYCRQCYCYVCDIPAPCTQWKGSLHSHCHATDQLSLWKDLRSSRRKTNEIPKGGMVISSNA